MSHSFGDLLRQYCARKRGLSQTRLAELAGYDRAILVRMSQGKKDLTGPSGRERVVRLAETLADEGVLVSLDEANALLTAAHVPPLYAGQPAEARLMSRLAYTSNHKQQQVRRGNLPAPVGHFIGRTHEASEVRKLLGSTRLLTLTGSGGCGKTRLAQHVAADMMFNFADGVWYVELAPLTDSASVTETMLLAFSLKVADRTAHEQVLDFLRDRQALLVLDNCEHLIDAVAAFTVSLLRACPHVSILTTSREALNVEGERTWHVPPMQPDDAAQLFVERAHAVRSELVLDVQDATIAHICTRLDGMPLAIELAAARLHGMSLSELAARLQDRFTLLTGGQRGALLRHQTLQATIDWSYDLLSQSERVLFRRLAVFVGGWTVELAEQVCADGMLPASNVLSLLLSLVGKSLVVAEDCDGQTRYHFLETIREYARQKLMEQGELETIQRRHAEAFAALAEQSHDPTRGPRQHGWMGRLERDYSNLYTALAWSFRPDGDALVGCRIFGNLQVFWYNGSHVDDAQRWAHLARRALTDRMPLRLRGAVWLISTGLDTLLTPEEALAGYRQSLAYYTEAKDQSGMADAMGNIGGRLLGRNPHDPEGQRMVEESVALARSAADTLVEHCSLLALGHCAQILNELGRAEIFYRENLQLCRDTGDLANLLFALGHLAWLYMERLEFSEVLPYARESVEVAHQIGNFQIELAGKCTIAACIRYLGDAPHAVTLGEVNLAFARTKLPPLDHAYELSILTLSKALNEVGEHERAQALLTEWLRTLHRIGGLKLYWNWYGPTIDTLACVASGWGKPARAARLFGVANRIFAASTERRVVNHEWENAPYIAKARAALGEAAYEAARSEGHAMTPEQAVKFALAV